MSRGIQLRSIVAWLEKFAPREAAESWDNTGLLAEPQTARPIDAVLLTNDLTEDVVQEAVQLPVQLIISYHPPIFKPLLNSITTATWKERILGTCLENRIAIYSPHTGWDNTRGGVSDWLLSPFSKDGENAEVWNGSGRKCQVSNPVTIREVIQRYKQLAQLQHVRLALARNTTQESLVGSVAVCAGSGGSVLAGSGCDLWVTGEMSHHALLDATHTGTSVLVLEHSNSERGFLTEFSRLINNEFPLVQFHVSNKDHDPISIV